MTGIQPVAAGDRFRIGDVFIQVTRVGRAKPWVDIRCYMWAVSWTKRMPVGLNPAWPRVDWTWDDVEATEPGRVVTGHAVGDVL